MKPLIEIEYEGVDATRILVGRMLRASVVERFNERLSEVRLSFDDRDAVWRGDWFPRTEDRVKLRLGYENRVRDFGEYVVNEVSYSGDGGGEVIEISATATGEKMYVRRWKSYHNRTLKSVVNEVAERNGYRVVGEVGLMRVFDAQVGESDLSFLHRLARRYGYVLKVESGAIVFYERGEIAASVSVVTIQRKWVKNYRFEDRAIGKYNKCVVKAFDSKKRQVYEGVAGEGEPILYVVENGIDSASEATKRASEVLKEVNRKKTLCDIGVIGDTRILSGMAVELRDFGVFDGKYVVEETEHVLDRGGYETRIKGVRE